MSTSEHLKAELYELQAANVHPKIRVILATVIDKITEQDSRIEALEKQKESAG
jgi:hypothetical protein